MPLLHQDRAFVLKTTSDILVCYYEVNIGGSMSSVQDCWIDFPLRCLVLKVYLKDHEIILREPI